MITVTEAQIAEINAATAYDFSGFSDQDIYSLVETMEARPEVESVDLAALEVAFIRAGLAEIERRAQKTYRVLITRVDPSTGWTSVESDFFIGTPADFSDFFGPHNWTKGSGVVTGTTGRVEWEIVDLSNR